ncbi:hypothetical protein QN219_23580 [Sinorhizobium sp. 7-81]|uniref:hypothetical protein n=1 Tax=unclassified Sinorhizobium TaxID=2613772 RepID=UPI0024C2B0EF|nr:MULTISPECIES: hypothetical protein [unclassified Sinorhizobium]MDK1389355.1 hypothetical protein [Sinorhizobium sp. 7-81]MDK1492997.1 hypothetical protein [Sinorhizobium sp. 8-89]
MAPVSLRLRGFTNGQKRRLTLPIERKKQGRSAIELVIAIAMLTSHARIYVAGERQDEMPTE